MARLFISYRRRDTVALVGRMYDRLVARYGEDAVFMDVASIPCGVDFRCSISDAISEADVLLAVIGRGWLASQENGTRLLDDPDDFIRREIEIALERNVIVIPVLVGGASMPTGSELPHSLSKLAYINAVHIDHGIDFHTHMERLIQTLDSVAKPEAEILSEKKKRWWKRW